MNKVFDNKLYLSDTIKPQTMYNYLIYFRPQTTLTITELKEGLSEYLNEQQPSEIKISDDCVIVTFGAYQFRLFVSSDSHVNEELREMIDDGMTDLDDYPIDANLYGASTLRVEMGGDVDMDMDHFNDCIFILEYFESRGDNVIINEG